MGSSLVIRASQLPTMRSLLILSLAGIVASKVIFPVPEPYRWDETFTVKHPQIDDEHRGEHQGGQCEVPRPLHAGAGPLQADHVHGLHRRPSCQARRLPWQV